MANAKRRSILVLALVAAASISCFASLQQVAEAASFAGEPFAGDGGVRRVPLQIGGRSPFQIAQLRRRREAALHLRPSAEDELHIQQALEDERAIRRQLPVSVQKRVGAAKNILLEFYASQTSRTSPIRQSTRN